jgi:hypothetical protein
MWLADLRAFMVKSYTHHGVHPSSITIPVTLWWGIAAQMKHDSVTQDARGRILIEGGIEPSRVIEMATAYGPVKLVRGES